MFPNNTMISCHSKSNTSISLSWTILLEGKMPPDITANLLEHLWWPVSFYFCANYFCSVANGNSTSILIIYVVHLSCWLCTSPQQVCLRMSKRLKSKDSWVGTNGAWLLTMNFQLHGETSQSTAGKNCSSGNIFTFCCSIKDEVFFTWLPLKGES